MKKWKLFFVALLVLGVVEYLIFHRTIPKQYEYIVFGINFVLWIATMVIGGIFFALSNILSDKEAYRLIPLYVFEPAVPYLVLMLIFG